jgi:hypothetical protein
MILADRQVTARTGAAGQREPQRIGTELVDPIQRVDHIPPGLAHLAAELVTDQTVQEHIGERHLGPAAPVQRDRVVITDEGAEHHHPCDPEEQNVVTGHQNTCRIELFQFRGRFRPT